MFTACNKGIVLTPAVGETEGGLKGYVTIASQCTLTEDNNMAELNVTLHALKPGDIMGNAEITFQLLNDLGKPIHEDAFIKFDAWQPEAHGMPTWMNMRNTSTNILPYFFPYPTGFLSFRQHRKKSSRRKVSFPDRKSVV